MTLADMREQGVRYLIPLSKGGSQPTKSRRQGQDRGRHSARLAREGFCCGNLAASPFR